MSQNATKCPVNSVSNIVCLPPGAPKLSVEQRRAIQLLLLGKKVTDVATTLGKDRKTIYRWRENPHFVSEYNRQQTETVDRVKNRLHQLTDRAVDVLEQHLAQGSLKAATELLKVCNLYGNVAFSPAQTDLELIVKEQAEKIARAEMAKTPFAEGRRVNDFAKGLAGDIAALLKEKHDVTSSLHEFSELIENDS